VGNQTQCDEQQIQAMSLPTTHEFTCNGRAETRPAITTPTSLAARCNHIISLIDEVLTVPAPCVNTADRRFERRRRESLPAELGV
jgi:hypothetical protein